MSRLVVVAVVAISFLAGAASQTRMVEGKPSESFNVGDVVEEAPREVSESDILTPTKVLLFRIADKGKPLTIRTP